MRSPGKILQSVRSSLAELPRGGRAWLAVSGGLDSMVLLEAAYRAGAENAVVAHVNHGLRGAESDGDEAFVRREAAARGYEFRSVRLDWEREKPSQATCRRRRDEFFLRALGKDDRLFLAHHADDQAETVMLRLLRGTGLDGLGGMAPRSGPKVRPLLFFPRAELAAAAAEWRLGWREDSSNRSLRYDRNWLRHEIFPRLAARRPGFAARLTALAGEARALRPDGAAAGPDIFPFGDHAFARGEELRRLGERALKNAFALDRTHTRSLAELLRQGSGERSAAGARFFLSQGILLIERRGRFRDQLAWREEAGGRVAESALGRWRIVDDNAGDRRRVALGEKAKKNFQAARVPLFFRDSLPVSPGAARIFLPADGAGCEASPLGRWWRGLNSS